MTQLLRQLTDNLSRVRERIAAAAESSGRSPREITLVAVTKYVDADVSAALFHAGCPILAESRPQQLWEKAELPDCAGVRWHLVGHLQRNKVARTLTLVEMIHSVDSLRLLREIDKQAHQLDRRARVLLEVNCSGDQAKHGFSPDELKQVVEQLAEFSRVEVSGLMTMAALGGGPEIAGKNFALLRQLRQQVQTCCPPTVKLNELSMGMSQDFEVAIREGATMVRIGSILFEGLDR